MVVLLGICLLSLAGTVAVLLRWYLTRVDALGRTRDFPVISVCLLLVAAAGTAVPVVGHARFESRLAAVASTLSGRQVRVRCETLSQAWTDAHPEAGYVPFGADGRPGTQATLTVRTCDDLRSWFDDRPAHPDRDQVIAVHVLTHEAMHLAGEADEAVAECRAVQRDARTAVLLGASPDRARQLAARYWREDYPQLTPAYQSGDCTPGGPLDEHLPDPPWPR